VKIALGIGLVSIGRFAVDPRILSIFILVRLRDVHRVFSGSLSAHLDANDAARREILKGRNYLVEGRAGEE
jgi:hypothetical protein